MKRSEVKVGAVYAVKVSGRMTLVRLVSERVSRLSGRAYWVGVNLKTRREVMIRSAQRLRREVGMVNPAPVSAGSGVGAPGAEGMLPGEQRRKMLAELFAD